MERFKAIRASDARRFGKVVMAFPLSNRQYARRFSRLGKDNNMKPPPGSRIHVMPGYLVVRKVGAPSQYETWMPDHVFEEMYQKEGPRQEVSSA